MTIYVIEPKLLPLSGVELHGRTRNRSNEARLGIRTGRFGIGVIRHFSISGYLMQTPVDI